MKMPSFKLPSIRMTNLIALLICIGLLAFAAYLQLEQGIEPCALCIIQRFVFLLLAMLFTIGATLPMFRGWRRAYHWLIFLVAMLGAATAGRQVWLTHLPPDKVPGCGPGLYYILEHAPIDQIIPVLFEATGECAAIHWTFLTLSIAEWTLIFFVFFAIVAIWQAVRSQK